MPGKKKSLAQYKTLITTHVNPDFDGVASMTAAFLLYPGAALVFPGGQDKNIHNFFVKSVLYLFNVVRPKEIDLTAVETLVVADTRQKERLGLVSPVLDNPGLSIHLYDHHPDSPNDLKADFSLVAPVGANVTIMVELLLEKGLDIPPAVATLLALGLYEDTGSFTFSSTTPRDLEAGARLLEKGADLKLVAELTARELTVQQVSLLNELILNTESRLIRGRTVAVAMAKRENHIDELAVLANKLMDIMNLDTLFLLVEMDNLVQLVARSRNEVLDVGQMTQALGGGGHVGAAAASFRGRNLEEVRQKLEGVLGKAIGRLFSAGHLMSRPVISLDAGRPVSEAKDLMARSRVHVLLVDDAGGRVCGYITEDNVNRAGRLGLDSYPVRDFMISEFHTVYPEASFNEVKSIVLDQKQRILPVIEPGGRTAGIITRTDLITHLTAEGRQEDQSLKPGQVFERSLSGLMESLIAAPVLAVLKDLGEAARQNSLSLYLVGGSVRDLIMHKPVRDLDLTLTGDMEPFIQSLRKEHPEISIVNHPRFKTCTLKMPDGFRLDLSSARLEYYKYPGALPVVSHAPIKRDLERRDFTVNAMALSLNSEDYGRLLDFFGSHKDIKDRLIRVLHSLSFIEDPTRAFRAVRFETRLGFQISRMTEKLLANALAGGFIQKLHPRRLLTELRLICQEDEPGPTLKRLGELGLLQCIHPKLKLSPKKIDLFRRVGKIKDWYRLTFGEKYSPVWLVWFLVLTEDLEEEELADLVENLEQGKKIARVASAERKTLRALLTQHLGRRQKEPIRPSDAYRMFDGLSLPGILYLIAMASGEPLGRAGSSYLTYYRLVKTFCTGKELIDLGYHPGPRLHQTLTALKEARLNGWITSPHEEIELAKKLLTAQSQPMPDSPEPLQPEAGPGPA
ncbi:MAG: CBS domain-containing protein [Deltaproteobacteria bacterium]|jgi:tRNA nucleotidyltransferase (CCA-adding enzyme)|nr:CBS domain-containing protein [Deltaproteobacteria bacterium]